jgi:hypothetical protein
MNIVESGNMRICNAAQRKWTVRLNHTDGGDLGLLSEARRGWLWGARSDLLFLNGLSKLWYVHVGFLSNVSYGFNQQSEQSYSSIYNAGPASSTLVVKRAMLILTGWSGCFGDSSPTWLLYPLFMDFTFNFFFKYIFHQ